MDPTSSLDIIRRIIGDKWKLLLISYLFDRPYRFGELLYHIDTITKKVLTENLRELESLGLVTRSCEYGPIQSVTYSLTDVCKSLQPILSELILWSLNYSNICRQQNNHASSSISAE